MASQVEVVNRALIKLGGARITSINDASKPAQVMSALWDTVRRSELSKRYWTFSLARMTLPALASPPAFGFANAFQLPPDYLKLAQVGDQYIAPGLSDYRTEDDSAWAIEGGVLMTDFGAPLKLRYVRDITDTGVFVPQFVEVLASKLAYEGCYSITQSREGQQTAMADYKAVVKEAAAGNAIEKPPQGLLDDSWVLGRL